LLKSVRRLPSYSPFNGMITGEPSGIDPTLPGIAVASQKELFRQAFVLAALSNIAVRAQIALLGLRAPECHPGIIIDLSES
jgi:hypothetical protein